MLGIATVTAAPSMAATTVYGSAQIKYTINATAQVAIATNYTSSAPFGQSAAASTILASTAGNCAAGVAETGATLTFGAITPGSSATTYTSCLYKNAILVGVNSNDTNGFKVWEYTDTVASGTVICAYANNTATMAAAPVASPATAIAGNGTCAAPTGGAAGTALTGQGASTAGTGFGGASNPGTGTWDVTATPTATTAGGVGDNIFSPTSAAGTWLYGGEDISFSANSTAASSSVTQTNVVTVAVIPN